MPCIAAAGFPIKQRSMEALRDPNAMSCKKPLLLLPTNMDFEVYWKF
jgi:hypothetical protein